MAKKMLGKVVAGAALGSASLLVFAPGAAYADGQPPTDRGKVFAKPHAVRAGEEVKIMQICPDEQEHASVWSKVTGKVQLESARGGDSRADHRGRPAQNGAAEGAENEGRPGHERPGPAEAESGGGWGGGAADARDDREGEEHARNAEGAEDHGKKDRKGQAERSNSADEDAGGWSGRHENGPDSAGRDWSSEGNRAGESGGRGWSSESDRPGHDWSSENDRPGHDWSSESDRPGHDWAGESGGRGWSSENDRPGHDWSSESDRPGHDWAGESGGRDWAGERGARPGEADWSGKRDGAADRGQGDRWEHTKDFVYYGETRVAPDAKPGTYELEGSCGIGELVVLPRGGVDGGDGGATTGADRGLATAGASLVGAAALGGLVLMRRRRADEFAA
ncbi:hypothetical protein HCA58_19770 [Micromonospora sp. HNM0581]|uniref:hypothetical protein n=1 Tax=Micromonospora sp. HNM0581 TaxID=2716341 RepID=UPI00146C41AC|nr:hypothetical protein [Micromonospora sp. HNM0581]NLU80563.1 hypothetical protein [Micromonospora sp. HNM0581]